MKICLFSSTPDMADLNFVVKVLTGTPEELAQGSREWGYDGIEFMPNPERVPDPAHMERALKAAGATMPVVNTGRMSPQGMALLHHEAGTRRRSLGAFKRILEFAGYFGARGSINGWARRTRPTRSSVSSKASRKLSTDRSEVGARLGSVAA